MFKKDDHSPTVHVDNAYAFIALHLSLDSENFFSTWRLRAIDNSVSTEMLVLRDGSLKAECSA